MNFNIESINLNGKNLVLSQNTTPKNNIFTLFTGKNGVGKTRLLTSIVSFFIKKETSPNNKESDVFKILNTDIESSLIYSNMPERIIVHTNSKYNKFPSHFRYRNSGIQKYFNLDDRRYFANYSFSDNNIFTQILLKNKINTKAVSDTLEYLNYAPYLKFILRLDWLTFPAGYFAKAIQIYKEALIQLDFDISKTLKTASRVEKYFLATLFYTSDRKNKTLSLSEIKAFYFAYNNFNITDGVMTIEFNVKSNKFTYSNIDKNTVRLFLTYDLIRYSRIYLLRISNKENDKNSVFSSDTNRLVNFEDLSSGQQAIMNTLLGISGVISNNSLICIDEPEISLHPEWQAEIINQLQLVFQDIIGCHFLIATHSPQVVSSLKSENSFIVNLEKMETYNASEHNHKSADYQLAKIFDTPGYNNEYLIRICLVVLAKISKREDLNSEDIDNINLLKTIKISLSKDDSVFFLIEQILSLVE